MENLIFENLKKEVEHLVANDAIYSPSYKEARNFALKFFNDKKIPTKKHEDWIYTNIAKFLAPKFSKSSITKKADFNYIIDANNYLLFNNGKFNAVDSLHHESIKEVAPLPTTTFHDTFDALNMAASESSTAFKIAKNSVVKNLTVLHLADENSVNKINSPRLHFNIEDNAEVLILEVFTSAQNDLFQYTTNAHTSFTLGKNAKVTHIKLIKEAKLATHIALTKAMIARDSLFNSYVIDTGMKLSRSNVELHLQEENSTANSYGLYLNKNEEHSDHFTGLFHHAPHTFSEQLYKGIINHEAHGSFTGKIVIDEGCHGVNSAQLNKNLLLSKKAHIDTRPQLIVSNDDVKCAHGATVGELSFEEEFYLTSRGIPKSRARAMLSLGFAHEVLLKLDNPQVFNFLNKFLIEKGIEA